MEPILKLDMRLFYSEEIFDINDCSVNDTGVLIRLKSKKHECECPDCHQISNHYHGTYERSVQDLPILGKNTSVIITAHEYECQNDEKSLLQAVDTAVTMNLESDFGIPVPDYVEENVSTKVVKIIQSYTGVVNKMVWRK